MNAASVFQRKAEESGGRGSGTRRFYAVCQIVLSQSKSLTSSHLCLPGTDDFCRNFNTMSLFSCQLFHIILQLWGTDNQELQWAQITVSRKHRCHQSSRTHSSISGNKLKTPRTQSTTLMQYFLEYIYCNTVFRSTTLNKNSYFISIISGLKSPERQSERWVSPAARGASSCLCAQS